MPDMPTSYISAPYRNSSPHASAGASFTSSFTWIVESTAVRAMKRSPSSVTTPVQRPSSSTSSDTTRSHRIVAPWSSRNPTSACVSAPEPPRGIDQLRPWRPKMIE